MTGTKKTNHTPGQEKDNTFAFHDLGSRIRSLRLQNGLTQSRVAEALHVTPGYISNVENNRTAMSLRVLFYYARLTGRTLDSLIGDVEPGYAETALDHEMMQEFSGLPRDKKLELLQTVRLWKKNH